MNFKKANSISGWVVCAIACFVYILTREATVSFWDVGEFTPAAYKLEITHAPGAPLFAMLGRLFVILFSGSWDATQANPHAAVMVNLLSALSSGFTILFLFWTITHMARKLLVPKGEVPDREKTILIIGAGAVGALAFAFSDSFWFSAVEGIVFGVSPLFISVSFWAILKWEEHADEARADRWIVFLSYIIGLSIGVHLLSLLSIPAIVMTFYFRRFKFSRGGMVLAFLSACVLTVVVQYLIIQDIVKVMGWFELMFVNSMGMPFNSGCYFFILLLAGLIFWAIRWGGKHGKYYLQLAVYCFAFILLGYASYAMVLIRANADPAVNMQNVNNPIELVAYLDRAQYGDWPILRGADFTARPTGTEETGNTYYKDEATGKYIVVGKKIKYTYDPSDLHWFPRCWDTDNSQGHVDYYKAKLGLADGEAPTTGDNVRWLLDYQFNWMYWRYFMWNFSGRQNDLQGLGNTRDGNWITGIPFLDDYRLGDQSKMPASLRNNKARAPLFMLPLILGILGMVYQYRRDKSDAVIVFLLFFFTGIAIILYLNQAGPQPRERDYSYVGSFYAFSIWIGLGVLFVYDLLKRRKLSGMSATGLALALCLLAVPILMVSEEWKAHDRSMKTLARDVAADYLNSCAPQAILFTAADNDTYPLWYAQEVENVRPDVRVIVTTLLGTDWMINELKRAVNQSKPIPISWSTDKYLGDSRNYIPISDQGPLKIPKGSYMDLSAAMAFMGSDSTEVETQGGERINYSPTGNFSLPVDRQTVLANGTVPLKDSARIVDTLKFTFPGQNLFKNDLMELNVMAANHWNRPICFSQPYGLGINSYIQDDGLTYRLEPLHAEPGEQPVDKDVMYRNLMDKFKFGGAEHPNVYFDENGRRTLLTIRNAFSTLAQALVTAGNKDSALKVLNYGYKMIDPTTLPYGYTSEDDRQDIISIQYAYAYFLAGDAAKGNLIADAIIRDCHQQIDYYNSLSDNQAADFRRDLQTAQQIIQQLEGMKTQFVPGAGKGLK
jgi:Protein of unknown function (DUF2723)